MNIDSMTNMRIRKAEKMFNDPEWQTRIATNIKEQSGPEYMITSPLKEQMIEALHKQLSVIHETDYQQLQEQYSR